MLNFLGVTENFSVIEHIPYSMSWAFSDAWTGEPVPLDGVTFTGKIFVGEDRKEIELDIAKGDSAHTHGTVRLSTGTTLTEGGILASRVILLLALFLESIRHPSVPPLRLACVIGGKAFYEPPFRGFYTAIFKPLPADKGRIVAVALQGRP